MATTPATATIKFHPRHDRSDRRQIDVVIAMAATLGLARHICSTMAAGTGDHPLSLVRRLGQRARLAFTGRTRTTRCLLPLFALASANATLRWRNMRIGRCLARLAYQCLARISVLPTARAYPKVAPAERPSRLRSAKCAVQSPSVGRIKSRFFAQALFFQPREQLRDRKPLRWSRKTGQGVKLFPI